MTNTEHDKKPTTGTTTQAAGDIANKMRGAAREGAEHMSAQAEHAADTVKSRAADEVKDVSSALRTAADEMRSGSPQDRTFSYLAEHLADMSDAVRDKDIGDMMAGLNGFARRNPLAFLGGAMLLGFAATRLVKASGGGSDRMSGHAGDSATRHAGSGHGAGATGPADTSTATRGPTRPSGTEPINDRGLK